MHKNERNVSKCLLVGANRLVLEDNNKKNTQDMSDMKIRKTTTWLNPNALENGDIPIHCHK